MFEGQQVTLFPKKMKEIKLLLKSWNINCFGGLEINKKLALAQVEAWDCLEEEKALSLEKRGARCLQNLGLSGRNSEKTKV